MQKLAAESTEYLYIPLTEWNTDDVPDPTVLAVDVGFAARRAVPDTMLTASWEPGADPPRVRVLVGPNGAVALPVGTWYVWVKIHGSPEIPVMQAVADDGTFDGVQVY